MLTEYTLNVATQAARHASRRPFDAVRQDVYENQLSLAAAVVYLNEHTSHQNKPVDRGGNDGKEKTGSINSFAGVFCVMCVM